jgi:hypothetical protein
MPQNAMGVPLMSHWTIFSANRSDLIGLGRETKGICYLSETYSSASEKRAIAEKLSLNETGVSH